MIGKTMRLRTLVVLPALALCLSSTAQAHIELVSPAPRTLDQKAGPCGAAGSVRGPAQTFQPGETITVEWDETVDHPGHYRLSFDLDGNDFQNPNQPDDNYPETLVDQITDKSGGSYSQEITFPDQECDNCTLQLMQIMTTNVPYNSFYFACSDIVLSNGAPGSPDAGGGGGGGGGGGDGGGDADGGCGCSSSGNSAGDFGFLAIGFALFFFGKRRRGH
jgi:MYXO-CTERM domain-containing protein